MLKAKGTSWKGHHGSWRGQHETGEANMDSGEGVGPIGVSADAAAAMPTREPAHHFAES